MPVLERIAKDGTAIGSGILLYQLIHKYAAPIYDQYLPWHAQIPSVGTGQTVAWIDFLVTLLAQKYGVKSTAVKEWLLEHGLTAGIAGLIGLAFTPAMFVVSGPVNAPQLTPYAAGAPSMMAAPPSVRLTGPGVMP
jgi:hypothetical protein